MFSFFLPGRNFEICFFLSATALHPKGYSHTDITCFKALVLRIPSCIWHMRRHYQFQKRIRFAFSYHTNNGFGFSGENFWTLQIKISWFLKQHSIFNNRHLERAARWNWRRGEANANMCNAGQPRRPSFGFCNDDSLQKTKTALPQMQQQLMQRVEGKFEQKGAVDKYLQSYFVILLYMFIEEINRKRFEIIHKIA